MGEPYDMYAMTAAHKTLPIPCYARITNLVNGQKPPAEEDPKRSEFKTKACLLYTSDAADE